MKAIQVIIDTEGEVKIDAQGFKGIGCTKATEFLEKALGKVTTRTKKPEFMQSEQNRMQQ